MTRERAKELLPIIQAYAEGKTIEAYHPYENRWDESCSPVWHDCLKYRIKPETKLRPYNSANEFLKAQKEHGIYLSSLLDYEGIYNIPVKISNKGVVLTNGSYGMFYPFDKILKDYLWQDGAPCGITEE